MTALLTGLTALGNNRPLDENYTLVMVTHARLPSASAPATPRSGRLTDKRMADLVALAEALVAKEAGAAGLKVTIGYEDVFHQCSTAVTALERAMDEAMKRASGKSLLARRLLLRLALKLRSCGGAGDEAFHQSRRALLGACFGGTDDRSRSKSASALFSTSERRFIISSVIGDLSMRLSLNNPTLPEKH
ncbi:hypothetical protein [Ensifer adhaerens]|uniref:hypothetical protein n=1 Tax=Ensifer adhaerens TaxID=106592 RepID=UPI003F8276EE